MKEMVKNKLLKSVIISLIISMLFPVAWMLTMGEGKRSPIVEKGYVESLSFEEREKWFQENMKPVEIYERVISLPNTIYQFWRGYLQASIWIFILVFILNSAFLLGGVRNEP